MKHSSTAWLTTGLFLSVLSSPVSAQHPAAGSSRALRLEVTPAGAFCREVPSATPHDQGGPGNFTPAGSIWTHTDGGLAWIGNAVSIGNFGSEVFAEYELNNEAAQLFSCYDTNPPAAIWTDNSPLGSNDHHVASAESTITKIALHTTGSGSIVLNKYTTHSSTPDWTYTFPFTTTGGGTNCAISRDGQTIVAVASNPGGTADIAVFSPSSNVPSSYTPIAIGAGNAVRGFDLSADGSTLYFSSAATPTAYVFDIATHAVVFFTSIGASFDSHAISGDGSVFAFGNFNAMTVYHKVGGAYVYAFTRPLGGATYCAQIDISDDGSTIAYGWYFYSPGLVDQVEAIDVPSQTVIMTDVITGAGGYQNLLSAVSISADGRRFAVGLWGDQNGQAAEMRLYARNQNAPLGTVNLPGSVFGIQISADGQRMVAGSKAVHANVFGNGGRIDLYGDATPFTSYCFGNGSLATPCPCGNNGLIGRGCNNSVATQGALLSARGSTTPDTVVLTSSSELPTALTLFLQGTTSNPSGLTFGDGVRCVTGTLKRIGVKIASGGTASYPGPGDLSITARSAAVGDPIPPGATRYYQAYYRDPAAAFCPPLTFNASNGTAVIW
jgi:hypothetical protein